MILSENLYEKFTELVYKKTGLYYDANKKYFVEKRIENRTIELGLSDYKEYYNLIKFSVDETEFYKFINDLTVNETYFFRDFPQLQNFAEKVLPLIVKEKEKNNDYTLNIWSAACSRGDEPYTLSIILNEMLDEPEKWEIKITASDINDEVLKFAKIGAYDARSIKDVPPEYLSKYFVNRNEKYLVNFKIRKPLKFKRLNFFELNEMKKMIEYDVIFCRNALIYFDDQSRKTVIDSFYYSLNPGGFIFLGHSESIGRISSAFKAKRIGNSIVYSKPFREDL
ncbi:CheR family methyltransferase [Clostridium beijerinckii]|uniref:CheR family methyltransferase n=1 Tax=Clostridium beijerinckii TaxID=1520 RepID=UPI0022E33107|nr:protein-glutamate O-methyltransferase CheR [Clostridium beijerinckii]